MGRLKRRLLAVGLLIVALFIRGGTPTSTDKGDWYANPSLTRARAIINSGDESVTFDHAISSQSGDDYRVVVSLLANVDPRHYRQTIDMNTEPVVVRLAAMSKAGRTQTIDEVSVPQDGQYHYFNTVFTTDADYSDLVISKIDTTGVATILIGDLDISRLAINSGRQYGATTVGMAQYSEMAANDLSAAEMFSVGRVLGSQIFVATQSDLQSVRLTIVPRAKYGQGSMLVKLFDGDQLLASSVVPWPALNSYRDARQATDYRIPLPARLTVGQQYRVQVEMGDDASTGVFDRPRLTSQSKIVPQYVANQIQDGHSLLFGQIEQDLGAGRGRVSYLNHGDTLGLLDAEGEAAVNTQVDKNWGIVGLDINCAAEPLIYHLQSTDRLSRFFVSADYDRSMSPDTLPILSISTDRTDWQPAEVTSRQLIGQGKAGGSTRDIYVSVGCAQPVGKYVLQGLAIEAETVK